MSQSPPNSHLEPPQKSVELEDSGAQESAPNSDDEDHFSDASEGNQRSHSRTASGHASPIPRTRVEKVDDNPSHGEVPGTSAYGKREKDSVPDEIEVIPEGSRSRSQSTADCPSFPEGSPVPRTMVERIDPERPSHGDVPGTDAYEQRKADAVPDLVRTAPEAGGTPEPNSESHGSSTTVPETVVSQVESRPDEGRKPSPHAHRRKPSDALPDATETVPDVPGKHYAFPHPPIMSQDVKERLTNSDPEPSHVTSSDDIAPIPGAFSTTDEDDNQMMDNNEVDGFDDDIDQVTIAAPGALPKSGAVDDFDDFAEEQEDMGDDDFGDFDDGFQEPSGEVAGVDAMDQGIATPQQPPTPSVPPLVDFDAFQSVSELNTTLADSFDRLFPASKNISSLPPVEPIQNSSAIFNTDRSLSLWSQLVAPPPLQPQNWVKSRIRRLFLVSLGVPVDLDEILPASKQKKLVLPSIDLGLAGSQQQKEQQQQSQTKDGTASSTHPDASGKTGTTIPPSPTSTSTLPSTQQRYSRRRDNPPPELDLSAVGRLCATTDAALDGLTDEELKSHVSELQQVTQRASSVLEYWIKRLDGLIGEKEAFEGVIENLVSHARRVRK